MAPDEKKTSFFVHQLVTFLSNGFKPANPGGSSNSFPKLIP